MQTIQLMEKMNRSFFEVEKIQDQTSKRGYSIINKSNGRKISDVSEEYVLIPNRMAVMPFIEKYGIDKLISVESNGAASFYKFDLGKEIDFGGGDVMQRRGYVMNSYNKTVRFQWQDAWFRKVCSNGLFSFSQGISISEVHYGNVNPDELIADALSASDHVNLDLWKKLKEITVTAEQKIRLISGFQIFKDAPSFTKNGNRSAQHSVNSIVQHHSIRNAEKHGFDLDNQPNGWGLLNNINWGIERATYGSRNVATKIQYNKKAEEYLTKALLN